VIISLYCGAPDSPDTSRKDERGNLSQNALFPQPEIKENILITK